MSEINCTWLEQNAKRISARRRAIWNAIENEPQPPIGDDIFKGKRMLWFDGDQLVCDWKVWRDYRGMPVRMSHSIVAKHIVSKLGKIRIV